LFSRWPFYRPNRPGIGSMMFLKCKGSNLLIAC
jgi:hypothetical protein